VNASTADLIIARNRADQQVSSPDRVLRGYAWLLDMCPGCNPAVLSRLVARVAWLPRHAGLSELRRALPGVDPVVLVGVAERLWPPTSPGAAAHARPPADTTTPP
jgi:hypothetical protein